MYERHFGLNQPPFSIAPDPRYLFMSERHREALAHLLYGVRAGGGFVVLTGEIGAGKTTVCRSFLEQVPDHSEVAYIFNPKLTVEELLATICGEFRIEFRHEGPGLATVKDYVDALNGHLLRSHAQGRDSVLIIDEAQNLSADVLEQLRLLTNLETHERKLLQIVLIGQPELRAMLARPGLQQLAQRVIARYHLDALAPAETVQYIRHRLSVAGLSQPMPFDEKAMRRIHRYARGVPRRINLLCDRALLGAYSRGDSLVHPRVVDAAAREVLDEQKADSAGGWRVARIVAGVLGVAVFSGTLALVLERGLRGQGSAPPTAASAASASAQAAGAAPATLRSPTVVTASATALPGLAAGAPASTPSAPSGAALTAGVVPTTPDAKGAVAPFDLAAGFSSLVRAESDVWAELAGQWGVDAQGRDPCSEVQRAQLQCFRASVATLALIRQLDRPGIITLRDRGQRAAPVVLDGFGPNGAIVRVAGVQRSVPLVMLADYWRGEFATLWRIPPGYPAPRAGVRPQADPAWLAQQLGRARGEPPTQEQPSAAVLVGWVHAFQLTQGLPSDGIAGPVTLMHLNRAAGVAEPRLRTER